MEKKITGEWVFGHYSGFSLIWVKLLHKNKDRDSMQEILFVAVLKL